MREEVEGFKKDLVSEGEVGGERHKGRGQEESLELEARAKPEEGKVVAPSAQRDD